MSEHGPLRQVSSPPDRPLVVFDGHCDFCRFWITRWRHRTGPAVDYTASQQPDISDRFPEIPRERFGRAVQLIEPDGRVSEAAEAVARLWALGQQRAPLWVYQHVPGAASATEYAYRVVADHRSAAFAVTRWGWGEVAEPSTYARAAWIFLRLLGIVYLIAFTSLGVQILGLNGQHGILPAADYLAGARAVLGLERFWLLPTLAWLGSSDVWLQGLCLGGGVLAALLVAGVVPVLVLPLLWLTYLSLAVVGREFLSYQWDALLLETGFLAIFLAPLTRREHLGRLTDPPRIAVRLMLWLLFRLMLGSGVVKLTSGDPTWHHLTALTFHFETQPIPTPLAWYAHQLPAWMLQGATAAVLAIEIGAPLLFVMPRRVRAWAFVPLVSLQLLIALTGNYAFFNLLSAALCVFLLDDAALGRWGTVRARAMTGPVRRALLGAVVLATVPVSAVVFAGSLGLTLPGAGLVEPVANLLAPLRSVNAYGLFAVMTTTRPELILEGSVDGATWQEYEFKYTANLHRRPPWIAPHQPRIDWQMWFAALGRFDDERWLQGLCLRLLQADGEVLKLLARDPFEGRAPRFIRAVLYRYRFAEPAVRRRDGAWWVRERLGEYSPLLSLNAATTPDGDAPAGPQR